MQNNKIVALLKGYKTRRLLKLNEEVLSYISQIKELQESLLNNKNDFETSIKLKTKKHIFIHTLNAMCRLQKNKVNKSKRDQKMQNLDLNEESDLLMYRYLKNQKKMTVSIAFKHLFDSQSRYKVAAKKQEFYL